MLEHVRGEVERRHRGLVVECRVARGLVVDALVRIAEDGELLVLGSRGLGGFRELLLGSVGLATAARAEVPVVVVRPVPEHLADRPGSGWGQILVGLDAYAPSAGLLEFAFAEAALRGSRLVVVHGWDLPPSWSSLGWSMPSAVASADMQAAEAAQLTRALLGWRERFSGTEVVAEARIGGAAAALVADSARADLVVVGRKSLLHRDGPGLGPVTHAVLHHARAPVAVVPHPVGE
jgi:nucleotide-binding universal stress UspA family protein